GIDEHGRYGHDQPIQRARRGCVRPTRHQPGNALDLPQWTATRSSRPPPPGECPRVGGPAQRGCRTGRTTDREGGEVSTRGAIAIPNTNGKGWWGRYHHGDSFPTRLGAELFRLYQGSFGRDHEDMAKVLVEDHTAGWSTIVQAYTPKPSNVRTSTTQDSGTWMTRTSSSTPSATATGNVRKASTFSPVAAPTTPRAAPHCSSNGPTCSRPRECSWPRPGTQGLERARRSCTGSWRSWTGTDPNRTGTGCSSADPWPISAT